MTNKQIKQTLIDKGFKNPKKKYDDEDELSYRGTIGNIQYELSYDKYFKVYTLNVSIADDDHQSIAYATGMTLIRVCNTVNKSLRKTATNINKIFQ